MEFIETISSMRRCREGLKEPVGFVPTMGFLHEGHLSLVRQAKADNASVVVSIFVNPSQFGPGEDLECYPRNIPRDLALLADEGVGIVFSPKPAEVYPPGFSTWISVEGLSDRLEGLSRPGHFRGVATICLKLFNLVCPTRAYFGQKDAQQVRVINRMISDLNLNIDLVTMPTIRESDGLALSSRNVYLSSRERKAAPVLLRSLCLAHGKWRSGELDAHILRSEMLALIETEPLVKIDYISIADYETLTEQEIVGAQTLVSLAAFVGNTRLIDNIILE